MNLSRADLTGADLTGTDLTGADLTGADLTGAKISSEDLCPERWLNVNLPHNIIFTKEWFEFDKIYLRMVLQSRGMVISEDEVIGRI